MERRISSAVLFWLFIGTAPLYAQSIAQNYPGDVGIESDPNVFFVEKFDEGSLTAIFSRWTDVNNSAAISLVADAPPGSPLANSLHIDGPSSFGGWPSGTNIHTSKKARNEVAQDANRWRASGSDRSSAKPSAETA